MLRTALTAFLFILCMTASFSSLATEPDEVLTDPALETRARDIGRNLRCVVCQSQSIEGSDAPLAKDMRLLVRERLMAGDTDDQVYAYLVDRYGDYILLRPPVQKNTLLLWAAPILLLLIALAGSILYVLRIRTIDDDDMAGAGGAK